MNKEYFARLEEKMKREYEIAETARKKGLDPETHVEIPVTTDLASRVEGLVGPKGVAVRIRELEEEGIDRKQIAFRIAEEIALKKFGDMGGLENRLEQALRTSTAILTEGVVSAPLEGISRVKIKKNPDGTEYISVYYAGPIRSAGGTAQAVSVLLADYIRRKVDLDRYKPTEDQINRYIEEINMYHNLVSRLQYKPTDKEVKIIVENCYVEINGEPTSDIEVSVYKNIPGVETNRIRGGVCLVIGEGIAQKAAKVLKLSQKVGLDWSWLEAFIKKDDKSKEKTIPAPSDKYLSDIVAGRPIFAYPARRGGFRLRYGRARVSGIAAKCIHPATMYILDSFPAIGTQLKIERPGKGTALTPCDTIEGPVVKLKDGDVIRVDDVETAMRIKDEIEKILFLGDMLISYGDFRKANYPLLPAGYCEEWWVQELRAKGGNIDDPFKVTQETAVELSKKYGVPLHPRYTYHYHDLTKEELVRFIDYLKSGEINENVIILPLNEDKELLEKICLPHKVKGDKVIIEEGIPLIETFRLKENYEIPDGENVMEIINKISPFRIREKSPTYIGARMGRPEKAKERRMNPPPHVLFPVGNFGGSMRNIIKAVEKERISVELKNLLCKKCGTLIEAYRCPKCGERAEPVNRCEKCGRVGNEERCPSCGGRMLTSEIRTINIKELVETTVKNLGERTPDKVKGVIGAVNREKFFEPIEKGILRAKHGVFVFKDGTVRFDATDLPITHFRPREIGTSVEKLRELGYTKDYLGNELTNEEQICLLYPQDIILPKMAAEYLLRTAKFIDDLLEKFYGLERYYKVEKPEDLVGALVIGLAPHTSAGILGRIIGFSDVRGLYAHPYFHCGKRRNTDGDEDTVMLLLDALLNFSKKYLPEKKGGKMDAPLILISRLNPKEVDDEVHEMEIVSEYPLEFYEKTYEYPNPSDVKVPIVKDILGTEKEFIIGFTHDTSDINQGPKFSTYATLQTMKEKIDRELELGKKLVAVDIRDMAARVISFHFLRDLYGNLKAFGQQRFRCVKCNQGYRRVPLKGVCTKCGERIVLTVTKGSVEKYLYISQEIAEKYGLSNYLKQRLKLIENDLKTMFKVKEDKNQMSLAQFI